MRFGACHPDTDIFRKLANRVSREGITETAWNALYGSSGRSQARVVAENDHLAIEALINPCFLDVTFEITIRRHQARNFMSWAIGPEHSA